MNLPKPSLFREHFKSNYHIHNLKRIMKGKTTISYDLFTSMFIPPSHSSPNSPTSSSSSEEDDEEEEIIPHSGSPMLKINVQNSEPIYIYKCTLFTKYQYRSINSLLPPKEPLETHSTELTNLLKDNYLGIWIFFLIRSGRVASAVIDNVTGKVIKHKAFKRYTTRRGQGGSQSSSDSSKSGGVSHSAGASIRRQNEKHLIEDVQSLLKEYSPYIKEAKIILWTDTQTAKTTLFPPQNHNAFLSPQDKRLRRIPISTSGKPTYAELLSCYAKLNEITYS